MYEELARPGGKSSRGDPSSLQWQLWSYYGSDDRLPIPALAFPPQSGFYASRIIFIEAQPTSELSLPWASPANFSIVPPLHVLPVLPALRLLLLPSPSLTHQFCFCFPVSQHPGDADEIIFVKITGSFLSSRWDADVMVPSLSRCKGLFLLHRLKIFLTDHP